MKKEIFILLAITTISVKSQTIELDVKDTIQTAWKYYCTGITKPSWNYDHNPCGIVEKDSVGIDSLRIIKTYAIVGNIKHLLNKNTFYLTEPKGSGNEIFGDRDIVDVLSKW